MATDTSRRGALQKLASLAAAGTVLSLYNPARLLATEIGDNERVSLLGCAKDAKGNFYAAVSDTGGRLLQRYPLPARGHGVAVQQHGDLAFAVARRPGKFIEAFNYKTGEHYASAVPGDGNYFYGHAVLSADGNTLFATEGTFESSAGSIGVFDVRNGLTRSGEITGVGIGPHELALFDDDTLVVAVGGIHTRERKKLNLETMEPSLVYVSLSKGKTIERVRLPDNQLSIRHLAVEDGLVVTGQQYQGDTDETVLPLVATHRPGGEYRMLAASWGEWRRFDGYVASVTVTDKIIVATSPRGNCYGCWDRDTGLLLSLSSLSDAAGASGSGDVWLSSGIGRVVRLKEEKVMGKVGRSQSYGDVMWDNHLTAVIN
ncbi:DUF1513 domain-containing protein [Parasalinivibrio latis]|uniref:DUF1513 domain-containing protein n=1 Tax=Parasalinivibrio latis TaxID=2952610 RepID=UPI0030E16A93